MEILLIGRCQLWKLVLDSINHLVIKKLQVQTVLRKLKNKSRQNRISFISEDHGKNIVDFKGETITFTQLLVKVWLSKNVWWKVNSKQEEVRCFDWANKNKSSSNSKSLLKWSRQKFIFDNPLILGERELFSRN